jgi:hypothetical protein
LIFAAVTGAGAWWVWRRSILGWWVAVALWVFGEVSAILTFAGNFDWHAYYVQIGLTEQQIEMTRGFSPEELIANPWVVAIMVLAFLMLSGVRRTPATPNKAPIGNPVQTAR